jgi:peptidyl-prolyl cis-trans isomerase B (cyclophilin B)
MWKEFHCPVVVEFKKVISISCRVLTLQMTAGKCAVIISICQPLRGGNMIRRFGLLILCGLLLIGLNAKAFGDDTTGDTDMAKKKKTTTAKVTKNPRVKIETTQGDITIELFSDVKATTKNFVDLVNAGFYNGLIFHRYEPGFVIQGGDPTGTGMGGSDKAIPLEITKHLHVKGAVGMARSQDPNSASCQFYFCLADAHFLDGNYCVFGQVVDGMDNVLKLRKDDKMIKVTLLTNGTKKIGGK